MSVTADIDEFNARLVTALEAQDVEGVVNCYTDDGFLLAPGSPVVVGKDALRNWWQAFFANGFDSAVMTTHTVVEEQPDLVIEVGTYEMNLRDADGNAFADRGKYSIVYRRGADGKLLYSVDSLSSSLG